MTDYEIIRIEKFGSLDKTKGDFASCLICGVKIDIENDDYTFDRFSRLVCVECRFLERTDEV